MTDHIDIRAALQSTAKSATGFPSEVANEGVPRSPNVGVPYAVFTLIPTQSPALDIASGRRMLQGLFQVSLFFPISNTTSAASGTGAAETAADAVMAQFRPARRLTQGSTIVIVTTSERKQAMLEPDWVHVPVTVRWQSFPP